MKTSGNHSKVALALHKDNNISESDDIQPLRCWDCNLNFTNKAALYDHLLFHVGQPKIIVSRVHLPPLKITLKSRAGKQFEIVHSPTGSGQNSPAGINLEPEFNLAEEEETIETHSKSPISYEDRRQSEEEGYQTGEGQEDESNETFLEENKEQDEENIEAEEETTNTLEELDENLENQNEIVPIIEENHDDLMESNDQNPEENLETCEPEEIISNDVDTNFDSVPGAEPTPPPEPSPELPKIRIKTTGLLKEVRESSVTITEISDDDDSDKNNSRSEKAMMSGKDDILSFISNNESRAKDFGFTTSDSEFLPADRIDDRNRANNAMQIYNQGQMQGSNMGSIAGLPMEALAQQVSRLQPGNGMHQQNVLINIQQFPQAPPPPPPQYQPPPPHMYHPPPQPMYHQPYQPYQPPPPNPMYYQPAPGYPPQHMPPPGQPQMPPMMGQVPVSQHSQQNVPPQAQQYRQPMMPIRPNGPPPRPMHPHPQRLPVNPRQPMMPSARQPMTRQRLPMPARPAGNGRGGMTAVRGVRPTRMPGPGPQNGQVRQQQHQPMSMKRHSSEHMQNVQMKRKKLDVLTPTDKDDDDCQVICMQPKNTDGGLPQIESVQGGTTEPENIMHLSDSITLSVRNPQPRPASPKKSDAKAVANILATRGITVTATPKAKQSKSDQAQKSSSPSASINLNGAVSIIPSAKTSAPAKTNSVPESNLPTVDLTDDTVTPPTPAQQKQNNAVKPQRQSGLPFKCDLCPAQYPNAVGLSKHRQNYHKTTSGMCEIGVPLINLKQPGIFQKLSSIGINNYIPLHQPGPDSLFALPIINARNANTVSALGSATMLTLGPVRNIPRPNGANKQPNKKVN